MYEPLSAEALRKMGERALAKAMARPEPKGGGPCPTPVVNVTNEIALPDAATFDWEHTHIYDGARLVKTISRRVPRAST